MHSEYLIKIGKIWEELHVEEMDTAGYHIAFFSASRVSTGLGREELCSGIGRCG
jgi:hypothetical protein